MMDSVNLKEDGRGFRGPPPVQPPAEAEGVKRQSQPSVSIEQAAYPTFQITVGDPHKVGDLTSSHIVYQVQTKVALVSSGMGDDGTDTDADYVEGLPAIGVYCFTPIP